MIKKSKPILVYEEDTQILKKLKTKYKVVRRQDVLSKLLDRFRPEYGEN